MSPYRRNQVRRAPRAKPKKKKKRDLFHRMALGATSFSLGVNALSLIAALLGLSCDLWLTVTVSGFALVLNTLCMRWILLPSPPPPPPSSTTFRLYGGDRP